MTRPTALGQRSPAADMAAALAGLADGVVQAVLWVGFLGSTRPDTSPDHADRGFGSDPSIEVELLWLLGFLLNSIVLVTIAGTAPDSLVRIGDAGGTCDPVLAQCLDCGGAARA